MEQSRAGKAFSEGVHATACVQVQGQDVALECEVQAVSPDRVCTMG